jgi:hypothetical protein
MLQVLVAPQGSSVSWISSRLSVGDRDVIYGDYRRENGQMYRPTDCLVQKCFLSGRKLIIGAVVWRM